MAIKMDQHRIMLTITAQIFERSINRITGLARLLVLERLSNTKSRVSYLESRRALRSRPDDLYRRYAQRSRNAQSQYKDDLKSNEETGGLEMNDYDVSTLHIPYGPGWTARRIEKLIYQTVRFVLWPSTLLLTTISIRIWV